MKNFWTCKENIVGRHCKFRFQSLVTYFVALPCFHSLSLQIHNHNNNTLVIHHTTPGLLLRSRVCTMYLAYLDKNYYFNFIDERRIITVSKKLKMYYIYNNILMNIISLLVRLSKQPNATLLCSRVLFSQLKYTDFTYL